MKNLLICGFESGPMMEVLKELDSDGVISIKRWLYEPNDCESCFFEDPIARAKTTLWRGDWQVLDRFPDDKVTTEVLRQMDWVMQEFARYTEFYRETYYEYKNIINHMVNEFYNELIVFGIEVVLFPDIPHGPVNALLYIVARAMGIDTLYLGRYNFFPGKFMYGHTIEEFGDISHLLNYSEEKKIHIEHKYEKNWDYVSKERIKRLRGEDWHRKVRLFYSPKQWVKDRKRIMKKNKDSYGTWGEYIEKKIVQVATSFFRRREYRNNINGNDSDVSFEENFVYMPLHLQPEMTVDTIGGMYRDQLLAVERLRRMIPDDWYIYVKENPFQLAKARDKYFFKRLNAIPNVKWVSSSVNTYDLINKSKFVATITGTAAWEAITGGKPALVFGVPWFQKFPGIFKYKPGLTWRDILNHKWNHADLEDLATQVGNKLCIGCWQKEELEKMNQKEYMHNKRSLKESIMYIFSIV